MAILTPAQHQLVSDAVAAAEGATSGEIVPVIAPASDGYWDIALIWSIAFAFTAMSMVALFPQFYTGLIDGLRGGWNHDWSAGEITSLVIGAGLAKFLGSAALMAWQPLRLFMVPGPVKSARVRGAAVRHFRVGADQRTKGRTGVLLYLSLQEHRAEIVADEAIATQVSADVWGAAMADMLREIREGRIAEGLAAGIHDVGKVLAQHFPRGADDTNELPDRLIEL